MATVFLYKDDNNRIVKQYEKSIQTLAEVTAPAGYTKAIVTETYFPNEIVGWLRQSDGTILPKKGESVILTPAKALAEAEDFIRLALSHMQTESWILEDSYKGTPNKARVEASAKATWNWIWEAGACLYGIRTGTLFASLSDEQKLKIIKHIKEIFSSAKTIRIWYGVMQADQLKRTGWAAFRIAVGSALYTDYVTATGETRAIDGSVSIVVGVIPAGYLPQV